MVVEISDVVIQMLSGSCGFHFTNQYPAVIFLAIQRSGHKGAARFQQCEQNTVGEAAILMAVKGSDLHTIRITFPCNGFIAVCGNTQ